MHATWQFKLARLIARAIFICLFRVRVLGLENVPKTLYIACVNHLGWAEGFMVILFFPVEPRLYGLGERDVAERSRLRRWFFKQVDIFIPLERAKPREAIRAMEAVLKRGGALGLAPEGKLGNEEGTIGKLQAGAAFLSVRTGVPIVPVGATGTLELWLWKKLTLRVGRPIEPSDFSGDSHMRVREMTMRLEKEMHALLPGDQQKPRVRLLRNWLTKLF
ncbi:MAG TPA: 1-acyl-sn-glycerol-3-phosphate acyltransferase [Anaerolineae bacterium]|nr:1-acyl-sn-glycerol-3-phosphate acyltransferase [Anaerolineae bacterium]